MRIFLTTFLILFLLVQNSKAQIYKPPIQLISNPALNDIAAADYSPQLSSFVIIYNPTIVQKAGPYVSAFFEAHEYAHIYLGHVTKSKLISNPLEMVQLTRQAEIEADEYAANYFKSRNPQVINAIIQYFESSGHYGDLTHLPHANRAYLIRQYIDPSPRYEIIECTHQMHANGDLTPCSHGLMHNRGDLIPCSHICYGPFGTGPCHQGDLIPCSHVIHPNGDLAPCNHVQHPNGDKVSRD